MLLAYHLSPLFADIEWVKLATFLVIGTIYLINLLASKLHERHVAKNRLPAPARQNTDTAKELEEFLKRTGANRRGTAAPKPATVAAPATSHGEGRARAARRKPDDRDKRRRSQATPPPSLVNLRESELTREIPKAAQEDHVRPSIDTRKFAERAAQLGHLEADHKLGHLAADHKIEEHLQQAFSHQLGTLVPGGPGSLAAQNQNAAAVAVATGTKQTLSIAALLRGGNLRSAIVLNEILERPEKRW